jgi:hypothetical protein
MYKLKIAAQFAKQPWMFPRHTFDPLSGLPTPAPATAAGRTEAANYSGFRECGRVAGATLQVYVQEKSRYELVCVGYQERSS